jgi:hypothetical protein
MLKTQIRRHSAAPSSTTAKRRRLCLSAVLASAAIAGAVAVGVVEPAGAAKSLPATLTATPGTVTYTDTNAYETFTGCGYQASTGTTIVVNTPTAVSFFGGTSDASGCIDISHNGFIDEVGTYYVQAWQDSARNGKATLMGATSFVVQQI